MILWVRFLCCCVFFGIYLHVQGQTWDKAFGPAEFVCHTLQECPDIGSGKIRLHVKPKRLNRTALSLDINFTSYTPINDQIMLNVRVAQFTNGGFKENYFVKDFPGACSTFKAFIPDVVKRIPIAAGYPKKKDCPVSPGNYTLKNLIMEMKVTGMDHFFYNKYRVDCSALHRGKLLGCLRLSLDVVPKLKNRVKNKRS